MCYDISLPSVDPAEDVAVAKLLIASDSSGSSTTTSDGTDSNFMSRYVICRVMACYYHGIMLACYHVCHVCHHVMWHHVISWHIVSYHGTSCPTC